MDLNEQGRTGTPVQTRHFWELARADFLMRLLRRRIGGGEGTLLDFGCGDGYLLRRMAAELPRWRFRAVDAAFDAGTMRELETAAPGRIRAEPGAGRRDPAGGFLRDAVRCARTS